MSEESNLDYISKLQDHVIALDRKCTALRAILERFYAQTYGKTDLVAPLDFEHARKAIARATGGPQDPDEKRPDTIKADGTLYRATEGGTGQ